MDNEGKIGKDPVNAEERSENAKCDNDNASESTFLEHCDDNFVKSVDDNKYSSLKVGQITKFVKTDKLHNITQKTNLPPYNKRALGTSANTYELENFDKNVMIIFNQEKPIKNQEKPRTGTAEDVKALKRTFGSVGFKVIEFKDLTKSQISDELQTFFRQDFTDYGCIAVAVLAHGSEDGMLMAKDLTFSEEDIIKYLEDPANPTLLTKPKLFIVQACRGKKTNHPRIVRAIFKDLIENVEEYTMPREADLLILHSTHNGYPAMRDSLYGSWLIQSLCKHIDALAHTTDLESIIVLVKREVAITGRHVEVNKLTGDIEINKQIPVMISTLIRKLFLKKLSDPSDLNLKTLKCASDGKNIITDSITQNENARAISDPSQEMDLFAKQYFLYLVKCLRFYLAEHPKDAIAQTYLLMLKTFGKCNKFDAAKSEMINILCQYFKTKKEEMHFYKYLFIKTDDFTDVRESIIKNQNIVSNVT